MNMVQCSKHGQSAEAFVCQHVLGTLKDYKPRGFIYSRDETGAVNAWCQECEDYVVMNGDEWNSQTQDFANISLVCVNCASVAATINGVEIDR